MLDYKMNDGMKEVNPKETTRAYAFEMWMNAPMPMLTFFKAVDVTRLARISKRTGLKFKVMRNHLLVIDDVGREEPYQEYGNRFNVFPDFVDDCERKGKFLLRIPTALKNNWPKSMENVPFPD